MPPKEEVKVIRDHLNRVTKAASDYEKPVAKAASRVYDNSNEIVTSSVFKKTKSIAPSGKACDIGENLLDSFNSSLT